jgi:glycosyltransferase involved in cell wall biosynthesis
MLSVLLQFARGLSDHGTVEVIAHGPNPVEVPLRVHEVGVRRGSNPYRFPDVIVYAARVGLATWRAARRAPMAVILPQDSLATGLAAAIAGRLARRPVAVMEHGAAIATRSAFFWSHRMPPARRRDRIARPLLRLTLRLMHRVALRLVDLAIVPSQESVDLYRAAGVPATRILRYHVPVDTDRFRPSTDGERAALRKRYAIAAEAVVVLSVSRLAPEKGLDLLIDAVARARAPVELVVAGGGHLRDRLEAQAERAGVRARFTGPIDDEELPELLRAADIFAYAARQGTNVPVAVLEAMASGLAVVATTEPIAHAEILDEGRGSPIAPGDAALLARTIEAYAADAAARRAAGAAARAYVEAHHAPAAFRRELGAIVDRLDALRAVDAVAS